MISEDIHDLWKITTEIIGRIPKSAADENGASAEKQARWCLQQAQMWMERARSHQIDAENGPLPKPHVAARKWRKTNG